MTSHHFPGPIAPRPPRTAIPPGACDCHVHVFPDVQAYPVLETCTVLPRLLPITDYRMVMAVLGLQRAVIVQPGMVYGEDNRATLEAARALGENGRAVGICLDETRLTKQTLAEWHEAGMRGLRFNLWHDSRPGMGDYLRSVAERVAGLGWHIEFYGDMDHFRELATTLKGLPAPFVIGHFGLARVGSGHAREDTALLRELLACRHGWIKLSGAYRIDFAGHPYESFRELVQSLVEKGADRLVWGTNWPHLAVPGAVPETLGPVPDDGLLLDTLQGWGLTAESIQRVLVGNPEALYDFSPAQAGPSGEHDVG